MEHDNHPNLLVWGNNLFISIDASGATITQLTTKYKLATLAGWLINSNTYTFEEVMKFTDNKAKGYHTFKQVVEGEYFLKQHN